MKKERSYGTLKNVIVSPVSEYVFVFVLGAISYFGIEMLWRGYSHITMFFAGGICFLGIYVFEKKLSEKSVFSRCFIYCLLITAVEFAFGVVFNIILKLNIWDYSGIPFNFMGQICVGFSFLWIFVSLAAIRLSGIIRSIFKKLRRQSA